MSPRKHNPNRVRGLGMARALAVAAGWVAVPAMTGAQTIEVVFTKIPDSPTSLVPGARDASGNTVTTRFRSIDDVVVSPLGTSWMLRGMTQQAPGLQGISIRGSGRSGSGFAQQGLQLPGGTISETYDFPGRGSFATDDTFAFSTPANTPGGPIYATFYWDGTNFVPQLRTDDAVSNLIDDPPGNSGDELIGSFMDSAHLLDDKRIGLHLESIQNIDPNRERALIYDDVAFKQVDVSTVVTLDGTGTRRWFKWDEEPFHTTPDGAHWIAFGKTTELNGDNPGVFAVDGRIRVQDGLAVAGSGLICGGITRGRLLTCGSWLVHGVDAGPGGGFAVRDGVLIAKAGDPVPGVPGRTWVGPFTAVAGNCAGVNVLVGKSSGAAGSDDVLTLSDGSLVVREGDAVDVDGNGQFDDDAFIGRGNSALPAFAADQVHLTDDGWVYFIANLRNAAGQDLNSSPAFGEPRAFLRVRAGAVCKPDMNGDGFATGDDFDIFVARFVAGGPDADYNADGFVTGEDFDTFVVDFVAGC